ncbi:hypothetical protein LIER_26191 [Lithospermum erythrorhizon]|uniref:GAG-pre-integrase domain-containing protein n=1 Tax=Lithospermum erythrorhizon TaxID=34254 RepID=A0AAV3RDC0_LITER
MSANRIFTVVSDTPLSIAAEEECMQATTLELSKRWHQKYGHLSFKGLCLLHDKEMVNGMPKFKVEGITYVDCLN